MEANLFLLLAAGVLVAAGVYLLLDRTCLLYTSPSPRDS